MNFQIGGPKKYGLITKKPPTSSNAPHPLKKSVLNTIDDEEDQAQDIAKVDQELARQRQLESARILAESQSALSANPEIFDYDSYVDSKPDPNQRSKLPRIIAHPDAKVLAVPYLCSTKIFSKQSRYVANIMNVSKAREIEKDRIYERKLLKERKQEDELFGDKEKFVTGAYREKLAQEAKWEYEDKYHPLFTYYAPLTTQTG